MLIHLRRVARAAARGRGPLRHASELPLSRLSELPATSQPLTADGPCHPRRMAVIASWWMLREIEAATLTLQCISFTADAATILLPVSKADKEGRRTARSLGCTCESATTAVRHVLQAQVTWGDKTPSPNASHVALRLFSLPPTAPLVPNATQARPSWR